MRSIQGKSQTLALLWYVQYFQKNIYTYTSVMEGPPPMWKFQINFIYISLNFLVSQSSLYHPLPRSAACNSQSLDMGLPKLASLLQNPNCGQTWYPDIFLTLNHFTERMKQKIYLKLILLFWWCQTKICFICPRWCLSRKYCISFQGKNITCSCSPASMLIFPRTAPWPCHHLVNMTRSQSEISP